MPKFLAIIPARGGSKGLPGKNKKDLCGKPLIAWTIEAAQKSKYITDIIVSSDDHEILDIAKKYERVIPVLRPDHLATDTASSMDVLLHIIEQFSKYDYIVWLQPTSPLRTNIHIDEAISKLQNKKAKLCVSVTEAEQSPYLMYTIDEDTGKNIPLIPKPHPTRRQDYKKYFLLNGAIYISSVHEIKQTKSFVTEETIFYVMNKNVSYDIDTEKDFKFCELKMNFQKRINETNNLQE